MRFADRGAGGAETSPLVRASSLLPVRWGHSALQVARRKPLGAVAVGIVLLYGAVAIFANQIATHDPLAPDFGAILEGPSTAHIMGTDDIGRDLFSRIVHGTRISLYVGFLSVVFGMGIGSLWGLTTAYLGGVVDLISQRVVDVLLTVPDIVVALLLVSLVGSDINNVVIALGIAIVPRGARLSRGSALAVMPQPYVESAIAVGATAPRIISRYLLPNVAAPLMVYATGLLGFAIVAEATLAFLGLSVPPPDPSWGRMLSGRNLTYFEVNPAMAVFPGVALAILILAVNLAGDVLRDVWDPRLRGT